MHLLLYESITNLMGALICVFPNSTNYIVFTVDLGEGGGVDEKKFVNYMLRSAF